MATLSYPDLIDSKPFKCWTLYELEDGRKPENTNNDHTHIGGHGPKFYAAVDTMYPKVPGEALAGKWSCPGQVGVVSPCWAYIKETRNYSKENTGALLWFNILSCKPPPVPLPGRKWDPGWEDAATGWKAMIVHMSEIYVSKRMIVPPGFLIGRLMDLQHGKPFVPHVHNEIHPVKGGVDYHDPRELYYDDLPAIKEGWTWEENKDLWLTGEEEDYDHEDNGPEILATLDVARDRIARLI